MNLPPEKIFIANCHVNKLAKLSRDNFLKRVIHIKAIRAQPLKAFTLLPKTEQDWVALERFYAIVNKGDFGPDANLPYESPANTIFGIHVPSNLYQWFSRNDISTILRQITLYSATAYHLYHGETIPEIESPLIKEAVQQVMNRFYANKDLWNVPLVEEAYRNAALNYCNSAMPLFLSSVAADLSEDVYIDTAYFSKHDWNFHVLRKVTRSYKWQYLDERHGPKPKPEVDQNLVDVPPEHSEKVSENDLRVSEANEIAWSMWLMTFQRYPVSKAHIYSLFSKESAAGYIYIFRAGMSCSYKLGWTADSDIGKRQSSLQTASRDPLIIVDFFPVSNRRAEKSLHDIFANKRTLGEWFDLSDEDIYHLRSADWRRGNNIF